MNFNDINKNIENTNQSLVKSNSNFNIDISNNKNSLTIINSKKDSNINEFDDVSNSAQMARKISVSESRSMMNKITISQLLKLEEKKKE